MTVEAEVKADQEATTLQLQVLDEEAVAAAALQTTGNEASAADKVSDEAKGGGEGLLQVSAAEAVAIEKSSSESSFLSHLKEHEKKALKHLKSKLQQAILQNDLFFITNNSSKVEAEQPPKENADKVEEPVPEDQQAAVTNNHSQHKDDEDEDAAAAAVDMDISLWGVPLVPSKGEEESTDVLLFKFLRARDFKVNDALSMLKKTLQWRRDFNIDSILDEHLLESDDLSSLSQIAHMSDGVDRQGHPICYNNFGALDNKELYGTEEKRTLFLRWRFQLMEKGIQKLDFNPAGVNSLIQVNDLNNSPGPFNKELRLATKQAVTLLQDNYPEFVARNIFINVPLWYYALNSLLSPFLTQRTKSKFVVARPGKVTETLLKYIPVEEIPIQYGGFKRDNDFEFSATDDQVSELTVKAAATATIEIPTPESGATFIWDVAVLGWEVKYKEEFVPTDEGSYTIIIHKTRKISSSNIQPVRNTFTISEPGKIILTIENSSNNNKKKVLYRYKTRKSACF